MPAPNGSAEAGAILRRVRTGPRREFVTVESGTLPVTEYDIAPTYLPRLSGVMSDRDEINQVFDRYGSKR